MNVTGSMTSSSQNLTQLLIDWQQGDRAALDKLTPLVYDDLRRIAHKYVRNEATGNTLQTTELVNEAYRRLLEKKNFSGRNPSHFFCGVAQIFCHILIDHA